MASHYVWHTIRFTQALEWQPWGDVEASVTDLGPVGAIGLAALGDDLHVLATAKDTLWHAVRFTAAQDWQPFNDVGGTAAGNPGPLHALAAAQVGADLHVLGLTWSNIAASESKIVHTIRFTQAQAWQPFGDVTASRAGNPSPMSRYGGIGCAQVGSDLHVVVLGMDKIFHTIRFSDPPDWQPFGDVNAAAEGAGRTFRGAACAEIGGDLHVVAFDTDGTLWHTIRFTDQNSWQPFGNASEAAGDPNTRFSSIGCANVGGDLHVVGLTGDRILHTIRFTQALEWQPWGDVTAVVGALPNPDPEPKQVVACASVAGDLHVVCVTLPRNLVARTTGPGATSPTRSSAAQTTRPPAAPRGGGPTRER